MHKEVLTEEQMKLLPLVHVFMKDFGLVGGTAIALQIGHRRSIDFDLFTYTEFDNAKIKKTIKKHGWKISRVYQDEAGQFTFLINTVQFTFFQFPFAIKFSEQLDKITRMPDLLTLAAMKAYTLGRRAKWKDYVDLFFIINQYHSIKKIMRRCKTIFAHEFNERLFREQLAYFQDINYSEIVTFLPGYEVSEKEIKKRLIAFSLE
ncbi:MAG: hypothetical protein ACD_69C00081G0003 [uncultured bacterium]|nr:MAG: hypothetical protein ACD_69C00081G0003 [uncultured bacterium]